MRTTIQEVTSSQTPESLVQQLKGRGTAGLALLRSGLFDLPQTRYSFVAARPFLVFRSYGSRCETVVAKETRGIARHGLSYGNPWRSLEQLMARYELLEEIDFPFPLGGCFGYWGYDLKNFIEPKLPRRAVNDLELPDCHVGFYDSLLVFDHRLGKQWIVSTGLAEDGDRTEGRAAEQLDFWRRALASKRIGESEGGRVHSVECAAPETTAPTTESSPGTARPTLPFSNFSRADFVARVERVRAYIQAGDVYQVNLAQRFGAPLAGSGWDFYESLAEISPAPFSAWLDCGRFQLASSSPEQFLRLSGSHIQTRPIKGTRPRSTDPTRDAQLTYELQTSAKEMAELVMITDLLRNDLGKVCEFGSVQVPELVRLERYPQVQHLVSTVDGRLRSGVTHFGALASCFPGGSITGAPKFRAMEIIDELEPVARGPYTGALGYLGFNRESQLSVIIRTAICSEGRAWFHAGAGIVADSNPEAEYEETLAKARGFFDALRRGWLRQSAGVYRDGQSGSPLDDCIS